MTCWRGWRTKFYKGKLPGRIYIPHREFFLPGGEGGRYLTAMASTSHRTPLGRSLTATQLRAGLEVKYWA